MLNALKPFSLCNFNTFEPIVSQLNKNYDRKSLIELHNYFNQDNDGYVLVFLSGGSV
jgi:hypothetical protein